MAQLAGFLRPNDQLGAPEETASLFPENNAQFEACTCYRILGDVHRSKGNRKKAIEHLEVALGVAPSHNWDMKAFLGRDSLAIIMLSIEGRFDDANTRLERAQLRAVDNVFYLGQVMMLQASVWRSEGRLEEAATEVSRAADVFRQLGKVGIVEICRQFLCDIRAAPSKPSFSDESDSNGECRAPGNIAITCAQLLNSKPTSFPATGGKSSPANRSIQPTVPDSDWLYSRRLST